MKNFDSLNSNSFLHSGAYSIFSLFIIFLTLGDNVAAQKTLTSSIYVDDATLSLGRDEFVEQIAVDTVSKEEEDIYMVGVSYSSSLGSTYSYCDTLATLGNGDAFLCKYKYNPSSGKTTQKWGGSLKYLGAAGDAEKNRFIDRYDWAYCLTVDHEDGNTYVYIAGASLASTQYMGCRMCNQSLTFQPNPADDWDGFIAKYDGTDGSLLAFTYFGGANGKDEILDIAIRPGTDHDVYVAGYTENNNLGLRAISSYDRTYNFGGDGFIAGFDNCLTQLKYYTYYTIDSSQSPFGQDRCHCIKFNADGNEFYVSGTTDQSTVGIATKGVYQKSLAGGVDAFVGKWAWKKSTFQPVWGTYIGGDTLDRGRKLTITDPTITGSTYVYVTGWTLSKNLKMVRGSSVVQPKSAGDNDAFIVKLDGATGAGIWATYFGGTQEDYPNDIDWFYSKKNGTQFLALVGITSSPDNHGFIHSYQGKDKLKSKLSGYHDAFFSIFNDKGNSVELNYATYLGGSQDENYGPPDCTPFCQCLLSNSFTGYGPSIAGITSGTGAAYVSFSTNSADVPDSLLHGKASGTYYNPADAIVCSSCSNCKHMNYDAFMVRIDMGDDTDNPPDRISSEKESASLAVYPIPNPFMDNTSLYISDEEPGMATIIIYDIFMRMVSIKEVYIHSGQNKVDFDFSRPASGLYIAQVEIGGDRIPVRLLKQ